MPKITKTTKVKPESLIFVVFVLLVVFVLTSTNRKNKK